MGVGDREKEGEEGLAGSAKAFLKLPITHTSPHQRVAALGGCDHVRGNGLAQLVCREWHSVRPTAPGEPSGGSTALVGQRVKGSDSWPNSGPSCLRPRQMSSSKMTWIFVSKSKALQKNKFWILQVRSFSLRHLLQMEAELRAFVLRTQAGGSRRALGEMFTLEGPWKPADTLP